MGFLDITLHLLNFVAPAAFVALFLPASSYFLLQKTAKPKVFTAQAAILFIACSACLLAGLWFFGRDGKMATYAAMLVVAATVQWVMRRGWKG